MSSPLNKIKSGTAILLPLTFMSLAPYVTAQTNEADEVIVTGSPLYQTLDDAITGFSVLSDEELEKRLENTIGETLKYEPGVSSTFFGAGASRPIIRGQDGDRVRVLNNGIGSIDVSSSSPDHAVVAEPAQAERIEVLRGASLLRYGSSGSGGIVNVIDGRIPDVVPEDGFEGAVRAGFSTVDEGYDFAGAFDAKLFQSQGGALVLHLDGSYRDANEFDIPVGPESEVLHAAEEAEEEEEGGDHDDEEEEAGAGPLENSYAESQTLTGGLSWIADWGHLGFSVQNTESDYGLPGDGHGHGEEEHHDDEDEEDEHDEEGVFIELEQTRFDVNGAFKLGGFIEQVNLFAGYADYEHIEFEGPGEIGTIFRNDGDEWRLEAIQAERNDWKAAYGLHYRDSEFSALDINGNLGAEAFVEPVKTEQWAFYTFQQKEFANAHLEAAARYEITEQTEIEHNESVDFNLFSLSLGGDYHISDDLRLGGTVFRTERAPTAVELFAFGPHLATGQFELGEEDLGEETATGIEGVLRYNRGGAQFVLNAYHTNYKDFIYLRDNPDLSVEDVEEMHEHEADGDDDDDHDHEEEFENLTVAEFTAEDATFTGFEAQAIVPLGRVKGAALSGDILVEYVRAKTDDNGNLPRIPPLSILTGIDADWQDISLRAELEYVDEANKLAEGELTTEDYTLVNLFAFYTLPNRDNKIRISASINNLFDDEARQHSSFLKDTVPLPGRNVKFSVKADF